MTADPARFAAALDRFDAANARDPNREQGEPRELLYGRRMSAMPGRFAPGADEAVRFAVRAQHIERWKTPRSSYPEGRAGYLAWRGAWQHALGVARAAPSLAAVPNTAAHSRSRKAHRVMVIPPDRRH
jgi:hypothetical protein